MSEDAPGRTGGARLSGRVVDPSGAPVEGASVMLAGASPDHADIAQVTGPDGGWVFAGLAPGRYTVAAHGERGRGEASAAVGEGSAGEAELEIVLRAAP